MDQLYRNIKEYRLRCGLSQEDLAKRTGYKSRSMIAKIESGVVDLQLTKIAEFANALGVTSSDLLGWEDFNEEESAAVLASLTSNKELLYYVQKMLSMKPDTLTRVYGYIDAIGDR